MGCIFSYVVIISHPIISATFYFLIHKIFMTEPIKRGYINYIGVINPEKSFANIATLKEKHHFINMKINGVL